MHPARVFLIVQMLMCAGMSAHSTAYVPFLQKIGLSLADVTLLNAIFLGSIFILEIPTGVLADGRSRGWSVKIGILLQVVASFGYIYAIGFWSALAAEICYGIGMAFVSGAFLAWLVDALKKRGEDQSIRKTLAENGAFCALATLAGNFGGNQLALIDLRIPWLASSVIIFIGWIVCLRWMNGEGEVAVHERVTESEALRLTLIGLRASPGLRWGAIAACVFGLVLPFNYYWSPFYLERVSQADLSYVWIPFYLSFAISKFLVKRGTLRIKNDALGMVIGNGISGIGLLLIGNWSGLLLPILCTMVHEFGRGLYEPYTSSFFQSRFESANRATAGSVQSFIETCGWMLILLAVTFATRNSPSNGTTINNVWRVNGGLLVIASIFLWIFRPKGLVST